MSNCAIRLAFSDFWKEFDHQDNFFLRVLRKRFKIEVSSSPDFVIHGDAHERRYRQFSCPRVFFTGENTAPDFRESDFALTSHYRDDPRHLRLPLYVLWGNAEDLLKDPAEERCVTAQKTKFCAFVVGHIHKRTRKRVQFFQQLSQYRLVDSGGRSLNNIGGPIPPGPEAKRVFLQPYKFNLCFENRSQPGYTTEKLFEAMRARCIPIYWGSPRVHTEFNPKSFLNYHDFPDEKALIDRIVQIDRDEDLCFEYLRQPFFHDNKPNEFFNEERLLSFFEKIFTTPIRPVGLRRKFFMMG